MSPHKVSSFPTDPVKAIEGRWPMGEQMQHISGQLPTAPRTPNRVTAAGDTLPTQVEILLHLNRPLLFVWQSLPTQHF